MIYLNLKVKNGGTNMIQLKNKNLNNIDNLSSNYKQRLCNKIPNRVYNNLKENKNKKLIWWNKSNVNLTTP
jgi:hypothetical protein